MSILYASYIDNKREHYNYSMAIKEEKVRKKKKIIIDALKNCLQRDVYSRITVQDIANEAGFSKGGVLHYFSTKEDIYLELLREILEGLERAHIDILQWEARTEQDSDVMAPLSALLGVESFILDKRNIRIFINLVLYGFEEPKIQEIMQGFIEKHKFFYNNVIKKSRENRPSRRRSDLDSVTLSRMAQTVVLFIGILESIDPTNLDYVDIVKYISAILKG